MVFFILKYIILHVQLLLTQLMYHYHQHVYLLFPSILHEESHHQMHIDLMLVLILHIYYYVIKIMFDILMLLRNLMLQENHPMMRHLRLNNKLRFYYHLLHDKHNLNQQLVVLEWLNINKRILNGDDTVTLLSYLDP